MNDITRNWRKLRNEELHDLYSSPNIQVSKLRRIRWAGHVAYVGGEVHAGFWWGDLRKTTTWKT
jgi:hypothetical protein